MCRAAGLLTAVLVAGCASDGGWNARLFARVSPPVQAVPIGTEYAHAELAATHHEGDFAMAGLGNSMRPAYRSGTAIVVHPTSFFMLKPGMCVVYINRQGVPVAHMLVEPDGDGWLAAGLNNPEPDDDLVTPANLVGTVRCAFGPELATVFTSNRSEFAQTLLH